MTHPLTEAAARRFETVTITAPDLASLKRAVADEIEARRDMQFTRITITTPTAATVHFTRAEE